MPDFRIKTVLMIFPILLGACQSMPPEETEQLQNQGVVAAPMERTELVVLRQPAGYSDVTLMGIEEGTYIWRGQEISPFGIRLSFEEGGSGTKHLHTVYFSTDSSTISKQERQRLHAVLSKLPSGTVVLSGYADPRASGSYNLKLSQKRVNAVAAYLEGRGISIEKECAYGKYRLPDAGLCD